MLRPLHAATAAAGMFALTAIPDAANAQAACGASYTIQPGDTLYEISRQCRVSIDAMMKANPQITDRNRIAAGWRIDLNAEDNKEPQDSTHVVQAGDTLGGIAERQGVNLRTLLDANPGVQPRRLAIGQVITVPVDHPMLQAHLTPRSGSPGEQVRVEGEGFRPGSTVKVGAGEPESEWKMLEDYRVDSEGQIDARLEVPQWAGDHDRIVFVVAGDRGREVRARFDIEGNTRPERIDIRGQVSEGVECPILTTDDGEVYSLGASGDVDIRTGVYAHVEGRAADVSFCQQGAPVEVGLFETIGKEDARLPRDYLLGSWTQRGGDCSKPDFAITGNSAGGQVVETSLEGEPRTGYVRLGDDPAFIFDRPRRELPLEKRRAGGLAVKPPLIGALNLGGVSIEGDGVVFIRCASEFVNGQPG